MTYEQLIAGHSIHVPEVACPATLLATITAAIDDGMARERADRVRRKKEHYLSFEIQDYLAHAEARGMSTSSLMRTAHHLRLLLFAANDLPVHKIKPLHLARFRKIYRYWPKNARRKGFEYLTDSQILAVGRKEATHPRAACQVLLAEADLRGFFNCLAKHGRLTVSPYDLPPRRRRRRLAGIRAGRILRIPT